MEELMTAIFNRWNAAGLDESIAKLYPAGEKASPTKNKSGSPETTELPRAEYFVSRGNPRAKTRNSRIYVAIATITVRGKKAIEVAGYVDSIGDAFINSEKATSNPMRLATGQTLDVDDGGQWTGKADDNTFEGEVTLLIQHRINNRNPA